VVIVPSQVTKLYKNFFEINSVLSNVDVVSYRALSEFGVWGNDSEEFHIFLDEWQLYWEHARVGFHWFGMFCALRFFLIEQTRHQDHNYYCWITYDHKQCSFEPEDYSFLSYIVQNYINLFLCASLHFIMLLV